MKTEIFTFATQRGLFPLSPLAVRYLLEKQETLQSEETKDANVRALPKR